MTHTQTHTFEEIETKRGQNVFGLKLDSGSESPFELEEADILSYIFDKLDSFDLSAVFPHFSN